jgi:hypothetical protein
MGALRAADPLTGTHYLCARNRISSLATSYNTGSSHFAPSSRSKEAGSNRSMPLAG